MDKLSSIICKILTHRSTSDADSESLLRRIDFSASQLSTSISAQIKTIENCCCFKPYDIIMLCLVYLHYKGLSKHHEKGGQVWSLP